MMRWLALASIAATAYACSWDYPIWIPRNKSADALYRFAKDGKAGYIDATGRVVIPPTLPLLGNYGSEFHDGLLEIGVSDGKYVDRTGKVVLDKNLYRGWDFSEGLAVAMRKGEDLWGFINTNGEFAISPKFATYPKGYVYPFSDGLAKIEVGGLFGYIDHTGEFTIPPRLLDGSSFADGMARVVTEGPCVYFPEGGCGFANPVFPGGKQGGDHPSCKFTFIDRAGRVVSKDRYDNARDFSEGLAPVRFGGLWGFIDKTGNAVIAPKFEDADIFSSGLSRISAKGLFGYADKSGNVVVPPNFKYAENFSEDFAVVGDGSGVFWYIDKHGVQAFTGRFTAASPFFHGLAHVSLSGRASEDSPKYAYIDTKGRRVFTY